MKRVYFLIPALCLATFSGYYFYWQSNNAFEWATPRDPYLDREGGREAKRDIRAGQRRILTYGLPADSYREHREVLRQHYGIELRPVAGCVVHDALLKYVSEYNTVMNTQIKMEQGRDVFDRASDEAEALFEARRKQREAEQVAAAIPAAAVKR